MSWAGLSIALGLLALVIAVPWSALAVVPVVILLYR